MRYVDVFNPQATPLWNAIQKVSLCIGMLGWFSLSLFSTLPGMALRTLGSYLMRNSFLYMQGDAQEKKLPSNGSFSLLSWNICGVNAGYSITDGGVLPWRFRIDAILDKMIQKKADVNCLYEVFDINTATYICEKLKQKGYNHFYFNIGPKVIGVPSGILVASKFKVQNPEFTPFPQETLLGLAKHSAKGDFAFDLASRGHSFARIHATHLLNSKEPQFPKAEEIEARRQQMKIIVNKMKKTKKRCVEVVTGDLNLDGKERRSAFWNNLFSGRDFFHGHKTWGGEKCTAQFRPSHPLNLDHTMVLKKTARSICTKLVKTGFDRGVLKPEALSDHGGLASKIRVRKGA